MPKRVIPVRLAPLPEPGPEQDRDEVQSNAVGERFERLLEKLGGEWTHLKAADHAAFRREDGLVHLLELESEGEGWSLRVLVRPDDKGPAAAIGAVVMLGVLFGGLYLVHDVLMLPAWTMPVVVVLALVSMGAITSMVRRIPVRKTIDPAFEALVRKIETGLDANTGIALG